jgi:hypothetical protein
VGDGDEKDRRNVCEKPVQITPELRIPKCMDMIAPEDVIRRIELFYQGGILAIDPDATQPPSNGLMTNNAGQTQPSREKISVSFYHGLGDCAHFAHLIPLYVKRGYRVEVECTPDKGILFEAAGATVIGAGAAKTHHWAYPPDGLHGGHGRFWQGNKMGHNISEAPFPSIGGKAELWDEFCASKVDVLAYVPRRAFETVEKWLESLPRPIILLHTKGNTNQARKSLPDKIAIELYKALLDRFDGAIILLDWDNRVPRMASWRIRHLDDLGPCATENLFALYARSDLLIGVDSGPLHAARLTDIPTVGIWMPGHYPATYSLPRSKQLNVVLSEHTNAWNRYKRIPLRLIEMPNRHFDPYLLADKCLRMLRPARYLSDGEIAADVQLQQFVGEWCRGTYGYGDASYHDRHRSFDALLIQMGKRFACPTVIETGTIRSEEDWGGAGFFTYLMGAYLYRQRGQLYSVDVNANHVAFARAWTEVFGKVVSVHAGDSVAFLQRFAGTIDVLYLDSLDTSEPGHAEHALRELEAALPKLHEKSLVLVDDSAWKSRAWTGKGARVIPWLMDHGWHLLYGGYQALLSRTV